MKRTVLTLAAAALAGVSPLHAQTISAVPGTTSSIVSVQDNVSSAQMSGLRVTATLDNGTTGFGLWSTGVGTLGSSWGVDIWSGANFTGTHIAKITMNPGTADTYFADWTVSLYQSNNLNTLAFQGGAGNGNVLFDRSSGFAMNCPGLPANDGTCGSNIGNDFDMSSAWGGITAQYSNAVGLGAAAPVGDLYSTVTVNFANATYCSGIGCFFFGPDTDVPDNGNSFTFAMDTDRGVFAPATTVPEPSTYALMAAGLAALGAVSRRRRKIA